MDRRTYLRSVGVSAAAAGAGCLDDRDETPTARPVPRPRDELTGWPTHRGSAARTGHVDGSSLSASPTESWRVFEEGRVHSSPAVVSGIVFTGSSDLVALDAGTGELYWRYEMAKGVAAGIVVSRGTVLAADGKGYIHAVDAKTGERVWRFHSPFQPYDEPENLYPESPTVDDGTVFLTHKQGGDAAKQVFALDLETGEKLWAGDATGPTSPAVVNGRLQVGSAAFDPATGEVLWDASKSSWSSRAVAVADGRVYVQLDGVGLVALDAATGERIWRAPGRGTGAGPAVADGTVYFGGAAYDAETGDLRWKQFGAAQGTSTVLEDRVYATTRFSVQALSRDDGSVLETYEGERRVLTGAVVADGQLYMPVDGMTAYE